MTGSTRPIPRRAMPLRHGHGHGHTDTHAMGSSLASSPPPTHGSLLAYLRDDAAAAAAVGDHDSPEDSDDAPLPLRTPRATASSSSSSLSLSSAPTTGTKRSRYLREADRRAIIGRIDAGEKQSALAKEFGVTRAAICHINKNRVEILTRSVRADVHAAARHPKRGMYSTSRSNLTVDSLGRSTAVVDGRGELPIVYEVRSLALALHLTTLRSRETSRRHFRATADRAFRVLLEEALAAVPTRPVEIVAPNGATCQGLVAERPSCAVFMSETGYPMLEAFRAIQPDSPTGFMTLDHDHAADGSRVTLRKLCAPADLRNHNVLLLDATCASALEARVAIQSLLDFGADESSIFFVALVISAPAVAELCEAFPALEVVTAAVDADATHDGEIRPGVGNFQERYFNTTTIRHSNLGSNVDL